MLFLCSSKYRVSSIQSTDARGRRQLYNLYLNISHTYPYDLRFHRSHLHNHAFDPMFCLCIVILVHARGRGLETARNRGSSIKANQWPLCQRFHACKSRKNKIKCQSLRCVMDWDCVSNTALQSPFQYKTRLASGANSKKSNRPCSRISRS